MKIAEERKTLLIAINSFFLMEFRRVLWKHSISAQEFLSYVVKLLATGDKRLYDILIEAKKQRAHVESEDIVHTDDESLYSIIERALSKKERRKEND